MMDERKKNTYDDSDMKVADGSFASGSAPSGDDASLEDFDRLRRNGDLARARQLGAFLAGRVNETDRLSGIPASEGKIALHRRLMVIFASVAAMESGLGEHMLVQTALNIFYDTLKKDSPELYDSMSVSGAITFYYLEYRKLGRLPADIGGAFAMLCGREEDPGLIKLGSDLFAFAYDYVSGIIQKAGFVR